MNHPILEVCVDSVESAVAAEQGGADRLELCADLIIGGTTPSVSLFKAVRAAVKIPIRILIRPRFGDFCYTDAEYSIILDEIRTFRELKADGLVIGCLEKDGKLCLPRMKQIVEEAGSIDLTCHRAFDVCRDPYEALDDLIALGVGTVLTSGQQNSVTEGKDCLKQLLDYAKGKITIMPGGGVNADVIRRLYSELPAKAWHMSGKVELDSPMLYRNPAVSMGAAGISEFVLWRTDAEKVRKARTILDETLLPNTGK